MQKNSNHYQILGVEPGVTSQEIKRAYRRLVKSLHPDVDNNHQDKANKQESTERMVRINEAYETLKDKSKRATYDSLIGFRRGIGGLPSGSTFVDEDELRQSYLKQVFHPNRQAMLRLLSAYPGQLRKLSLDIYDDRLVQSFDHYCDQFEGVLRKASESFARDGGPRSLEAAVQLMRYAIAQAADGLEEMRRFCQNYDYDHLTMAGSLLKIAKDLANESLKLTR